MFNQRICVSIVMSVFFFDLMMTPKECIQKLATKFQNHGEALEPFEIKLIEKFLEKNPPINYNWLNYPYIFSVKKINTYDVLIFFNYFRWGDSPEGFNYWLSYQEKWLFFLATYNLKHGYYNHNDFETCLKTRLSSDDGWGRLVAQHYSSFYTVKNDKSTIFWD